jgi:hypothetical protein
MIPSFLMFLAPGNPTQATPTSPPAVASPAGPLVPSQKSLKKGSIKFGATVLGNAIGCGAIFAACWFSLQLMQVLMIP